MVRPIRANGHAETDRREAQRRDAAYPGLDLGERVAAIDLAASSPEELGVLLRSEIERWGPVIKKLGLKAQ